ncbi:hypothetical protein NP233_g1393 [Leucocoprinus birnbaumii]|uniref:Vps72/YL1 C-terminal domain-containing protein n=1 Tax=Leucocoprinus birnbaumii TaxID=56174 RepID=A0AAD5W057_9AGAR|nr:hypothetical protein NP233_g1393 [Leucocoprinus birnbaumii]
MADTLATRRSRRSTAGNRMEAALAEMALDDANKDLDDDNEFLNEKDEEDQFESDFASTDEEAEQEGVDAGEKAIDDEEKSARKAARARLEKRTAAAHAKNKATFNPQAVAPPVVKPKPKPTATFDVPEASTSSVPIRAGQKRKSQRRHTASAPKKFKPTIKTYSQAELIQRALDNEEGNIKEHKNYLQEEEEKRKKARVIKMPAVEGPLLRWISKGEDEKFKVQVEVTPPQPQPQAATVPTYGGYTVAQLNSYYAQLYQYLASHPGALSAVTAQAAISSQPATVQTSTSQLATAPSSSTVAQTGASPQVSVSQTSTSQLGTTPSTAASSMATSAATPSTSTVPATTASLTSSVPSATNASTVSATPTVPATTTAAPATTSTASTTPTTSLSTAATASTSTTPASTAFSTYRAQNTTAPYPFAYYTQTTTTPASTTIPTTFQPTLFTPTVPTTPSQPPPKQYREEERTEKVTKNYVVVENDQREGIAKPPWKDMMKAMFGDHVKWDELKVLSGKGRPLARVKQRCPITGEIAPYLDPRTGVPFADVEAYKVLTELLEHEYAWSPEFGCYVSRA